jgi:hypothetical protein
MDLAPTTNQAGIVDTLFFSETEFGFVQKSRQIKDLERVQAQNIDLRPDFRLNWVLLPRTPGCASA